MGVPKFYRWLSERYPKINQRYGVRPDPELSQKHFDRAPPSHPIFVPDILSETGLPPEIDRLYIDVNGILHGCSHNNNSEEEGSSDVSIDTICKNVCFYLDRIVKDVARPKELLYLAIDGVAPRAKLNQQRARRYRSGKEGEIERTVFDAHVQALEKERREQMELEQLELEHQQQQQYRNGQQEDDLAVLLQGDDDPPFKRGNNKSSSTSTSLPLKEVGLGRFTGKFETTEDVLDDDDDSGDERNKDTENATTTPSTQPPKKRFHSIAITPGTEFFQTCTKRIEEFLQDRLANDPDWQHLTVIFSNSNVPGEGEHKIMQFIREQRCLPDYDPNLRHCIMGQDGDLILLGLATHEPNLMLLREQVVFDKRALKRDALAQTMGLDLYLFNANFEFLHMNVLRDYLAYDLETILPNSRFDLERTIDDFVLLSMFVGNDFIPSVPVLDIADEAFDLLFYTYRALRKQWAKETPDNPYLTHAGEIVSGKRLEHFLSTVGAHEGKYYDYKMSVKDLDHERMLEIKYGRPQTPSDIVLERKEADDRKRYRELLMESSASSSSSTGQQQHPNFTPVLSAASKASRRPNSKSENDDDDIDDMDHEQQVRQLRELLQLSLTDNPESTTTDWIDDKDLKGRYYADKFGFSPFDADKHIALRKAYVEGLVWNLKYYTHGCVSFGYFYPYHYAPFMSDLVDMDNILAEISFDGKEGAPLQPFEQLLACLPPSYAMLLPKPYRKLMRTKTSPIADFYPKSFVIDMNGKRLPWEAVVLLPFIDSERLIAAANTISHEELSEEERERNQPGVTKVLYNSKHNKIGGTVDGVDETASTVTIIPFDASSWTYTETTKPILLPQVLKGTQVPLPGLPTLRDGTITGLWRKYIPLNVHGSRSRYKIACLEMQNALPEIIPLEAIAQQFIGTAVVIDYPHFVEALVTAVSDMSGSIRGKGTRLTPWTAQELADRKTRVKNVMASYVVGEKLVGTGGLALAAGRTAMEDLDVLMFVRPLKEIKTLPDGTIGKIYARFEVEVPLFVTSWSPTKPDPRLVDVPALLEKDPYNAAEFVVTHRLTGDVAGQGRRGVEKEKGGGKAFRFPAPRGLSQNNQKTSMSRSYYTDTNALSMPSLLHMESLMRPFHQAVCSQNQQPRAAVTSLSSRVGNHSFLPRWQPEIKRTTNVRRYAAPRTRLVATGLLVAGWLMSFAGAVSGGFTTTPHEVFDPTGGVFSSATNLDQNNVVVDHTSANLKKHDSTPPLLFEHGTTTLSFTFEHGVVVAVDSRASLGSFVGSKTVHKVLPIHSHMLATMAGGAADCSHWIRKIKAIAKLYELQNQGKRMSVTRASRLLANILYSLKQISLSVGTMVVGYDDGDKAKIYYVDNTGIRIEGDMFSVGSGSTFALGILDTEHRWNMTVEEAIRLGIKAIRHATFRDAASGGWINVYVITKEEGWKHVFAQDLASMRADEEKKLDA